MSNRDETKPRWQAWGLDADPPILNPYLNISARDDAGAPERPGPSLAESSLNGFRKIVPPPPRHHE